MIFPRKSSYCLACWCQICRNFLKEEEEDNLNLSHLGEIPSIFLNFLVSSLRPQVSAECIGTCSVVDGVVSLLKCLKIARICPIGIHDDIYYNKGSW